DRNAYSGVSPGPHLGKREVQHVVGQRADNPSELGAWNELVRTHQTAYRVLPAHQRLDTGDFPGVQAHFGLVVQEQFAAIQTSAQLSENGQVFWRSKIRFRVVREYAHALLFGWIHGDVGALHESRSIVTVQAGNDHPDTGFDIEFDTVDLKSRSDHGV